MMDNLTSADFQRLATFLHGYSGIRLPAVRKAMMEGRLRRRVRALGLPSLQEYCRRLFEDSLLESEFAELINMVASSKAEFFRQPEHFRLLAEHVLPGWTGGEQRPLKVWSAVASSGAEPYTVAMVLDNHARRTRGFHFSILATDICSDLLDKARLAIYPEEMLGPVPKHWRRRYFLRSCDPCRRAVRLIPPIRQAVHYRRLNLMDDTYAVDTDHDIIFCRNLLAYFDKTTQEKVLRRLCRHLSPCGLLFISHSDTVAGMDLPIQQVAPAVFART